MDELPKAHFGAILADPPWHYAMWSEKADNNRLASKKYRVMEDSDIFDLPISELAAENSVLFIWATWPKLLDAIKTIEAWGFCYKTCAFDWTKANNTQPHFFKDEIPVQV